MTRRARRTRRPPIRTRLALWSTGGLLVVIVVVGAAMAVGLRSGLRDRAHESLEVPFRIVEHQLRTDPDTSLREVLEAAPPSGERHDEVIGQILDADGNVIDSTGEPGVRTPVVEADVLRTALQDGQWYGPKRLADRDSDDIVVVVPIRSGPRAGGFVVLAQTLAPTDAEVQRVVRLFLLLGPAVLVASFLGGWWIARASLAPVDALTRQATLIDPEKTDTVLPVPPGDDEISRLARALNDMVGRLRLELDRQRRFSADASHELRSPLALMTTELDVSLRSPDTPDAARPILESLQEDVARLSATVNDLLVLSRAEAGGSVALARSETDLLDLAVTVAARFQSTAAAHEITIAVTGTPVAVDVDPHLLSQAIANLVDNALKFSAPGSRIDVAVTDDATPQVTVEDHGDGIPADDLPHVFERFYRVDRARGPGGSGLGLAIVESIARAHGGTVDVISTPGEGSRFTIRLPGAGAGTDTGTGTGDEEPR